MKKTTLNKIISILLSLSLILVSVFSFSIPVYAGSLKDGIIDVLTFPLDYLREIFKTSFGISVDCTNYMNEITNAVNEHEINGSDGAITSDGDNYYINQNIINEFNKNVQDSVHALDGYYLIPAISPEEFYNTYKSFFDTYDNGHVTSYDYFYKYLYRPDAYNNHFFRLVNSVPYLYQRYYKEGLLYVKDDGSISIYNYDSSFRYHVFNLGDTISNGYSTVYRDFGFSYNQITAIGAPLKIFYSTKDIENYQNGGRTYAPNLPSSGLTIPVGLFNPDGSLNINLDSLIDKLEFSLPDNPTETQVQDSMDDLMRQFMNLLSTYQPSAPTPTPSIGDGSTPTPTPDIGDKPITPTPDIGDKPTETDLTEVIEYLKAISDNIEKVVSFLDAYGKGELEGTVGGCKYDYTELSEFMTTLWNASDQKFDKMVELLEKNNDYQQDIVDSLNQIKALMVVDTVMDFFKDRSNETANKAKEKFPTSIPWDVAMVVNAMCAEPQDPVIRCPIKIDSLNINEEITVDLSTDEWGKLAKTCRSMLSILFVLYLVHLSRELFFKGGDS